MDWREGAVGLALPSAARSVCEYHDEGRSGKRRYSAALREGSRCSAPNTGAGERAVVEYPGPATSSWAAP
jgi:hypothetical protein